MRRVGKRLPDFFRRVAQFSDKNERPLFSVLSHLRPAGRARCVLLAIGHLLLLTARCRKIEAFECSPPLTCTLLKYRKTHIRSWFARRWTIDNRCEPSSIVHRLSSKGESDLR